jgi:fused signal recognition particle receptor
MVGVNGTGKTTTAAKLAKHFQQEGAKVLLAAGDTFRAAAGEQLEIWSERLSVELVRHPHGSDPAAVVFDACDAALARGIDYLIVDTAGRLHTKENLMRELEKIRRVAEKKIPGSPHEALLVLDATTGQNAMSQAQLFAKGVGLSGIVLSKLDGTAKGGIAIAINREVELPIKLIGTGEKADDLAPFDPETFVSALFAGLATTEELEAEEEAAAAEVQPQEEVVPEPGEGELEEDAEAGEVVEPAEETEVPAESTAEPAGGESAEDEEPANEPEPEPEKPKKKRGWLW